MWLPVPGFLVVLGSIARSLLCVVRSLLLSEVALRVGHPGLWVIFFSLSPQHQPARQGQLLI